MQARGISPAKQTEGHHDRGAVKKWRGLAPDTRFFIPAPNPGATRQFVDLVKAPVVQGRARDCRAGDDTAGGLVHGRNAGRGQERGTPDDA